MHGRHTKYYLQQSNGNNHPSILPFFQILAIPTMFFCHFTFQQAQIAIMTYDFCHFPEK